MPGFTPYLNGYSNAHVQLWDYLRHKTLTALKEASDEKARVSSADEVRKRGRRIRRTFIDSLGGLPDCDAELNAKTVGVLDREPYRIEKVVFESLPRVYVTALLYVPTPLPGPAPSVLFLCGHGREAKAYPEYQRVCHDLACNGFVTLAIDPTGQGERVTHLDPDSGVMEIPWGTAEHSYQGIQCILAGTSIARYFLYDALRGIDYLQSREEVDPERIGVTGNSGGGTQTSLVCMSGDERVKAAVPCTYVTSREHYVLTGQPQDAEQIQFGMTVNGINFDDFFIPFAPRPLLVGAVDSDFFPPEGTALTMDRLTRLYDLCGFDYLVGWHMGPGLHQYSKELRQAAVNWFRMHLAGLEPGFTTRDDEAFEILPDSALWCTAKGHVPTDYPDARTPYHLNLDCIVDRPEGRDARALREAMLDALAIRERVEEPDEPFPRLFEPETADGLTRRALFFISEPGIAVSGCVVHAADAQPNTVHIVLTPSGTLDMEAAVKASRDILDRAEALFVFDVRGTGAVKAEAINAFGEDFPASLFNTESWMAFLAYCLKDCLLGMRVFDVLRAAFVLRSSLGFERVGLHATELAPALWGYLAAALDTSIDPVSVDGLIPSFEQIVRTQLYRTDFSPSLMVHGVLRQFDLPDLDPLFAGRDVRVVHAPVPNRAQAR
ncbi:MAG: prolyl oligopeptidase family serine peptidase [bacterium]|nr:prolyl oligopeptidase family serine peptidase [bacterium]